MLSPISRVSLLTLPERRAESRERGGSVTAVALWTTARAALSCKEKLAACAAAINVKAERRTRRLGPFVFLTLCYLPFFKNARTGI